MQWELNKFQIELRKGKAEIEFNGLQAICNVLAAKIEDNLVTCKELDEEIDKLENVGVFKKLAGGLDRVNRISDLKIEIKKRLELQIELDSKLSEKTREIIKAKEKLDKITDELNKEVEYWNSPEGRRVRQEIELREIRTQELDEQENRARRIKEEELEFQRKQIELVERLKGG